MSPSPSAIRLVGHDRRFAESISQIDTELDFQSGEKVASRREAVVAAARSAYGMSDDFRGVRDAWDAVFPEGVYSADGLAEAKRLS
jgi:enhancing lycopene biosynthesis protein 2